MTYHFLNTNNTRYHVGCLKYTISLSSWLHFTEEETEAQRGHLPNVTWLVRDGIGNQTQPGPEHSILPSCSLALFSQGDFRETAVPPAIKENACAVTLRCFYVLKIGKIPAVISPQTVFKYQCSMRRGERKRLTVFIPAPTCSSPSVNAAVPQFCRPGQMLANQGHLSRQPLANAE